MPSTELTVLETLTHVIISIILRSGHCRDPLFCQRGLRAKGAQVMSDRATIKDTDGRAPEPGFSTTMLNPDFE